MPLIAVVLLFSRAASFVQRQFILLAFSTRAKWLSERFSLFFPLPLSVCMYVFVRPAHTYIHRESDVGGVVSFNDAASAARACAIQPAPVSQSESRPAPGQYNEQSIARLVCRLISQKLMTRSAPDARAHTDSMPLALRLFNLIMLNTRAPLAAYSERETNK